MLIDAYFKNVIVEDISYKMTIVQGEKCTLRMRDHVGEVEVFANNDPVLEFKQDGNEVVFTTGEVGESKFRIMTVGEGPTIVRELLFVVVASVEMASTLGTAFSAPVTK